MLNLESILTQIGHVESWIYFGTNWPCWKLILFWHKLAMLNLESILTQIGHVESWIYFDTNWPCWTLNLFWHKLAMLNLESILAQIGHVESWIYFDTNWPCWSLNLFWHKLAMLQLESILTQIGHVETWFYFDTNWPWIYSVVQTSSLSGEDTNYYWHVANDMIGCLFCRVVNVWAGKQGKCPLITSKDDQGPGGHFKNTYELLNLRALKFSPANKVHIFQCKGKIFCVEFQRYPLKFHTKYLTHTLKDMIFIQHLILRALRFKSSNTFLKHPQGFISI